MGAKKQFSSPAVLQVVSLQLEEDLLLGPSADLQVLAAGQDYFEWNMDVEDAYTVDDWTMSD
jgi:hypothetical protein